jgi:membrane protease subunit HflC
MKNLTIPVFLLLLFIVLVLVSATFQVRETESALVTTFGKTTRTFTTPGLRFKWPPPIESVHKFDSRLRVLEAELGETTTKGAVPVIVNTFIVWRIAEPNEFFKAVGSVSEAETKLISQISDTQNKVIGRHFFSEFVNSDASKIQFGQIENEMHDELASAVRDKYGIEIKAVGIKQLKINEDVSKDVFERMRKERERRTEATIAEGTAAARKITTDADSMQTELLAAADSRAKAVRAQGDAEAAQYYKLLEEDPQLAMFLRDIEALKKILEKRSTLVIGADSEPFRILKEMPKIEPQKPDSKEK